MGTVIEIIRLQEVIWVTDTLREMIVECRAYWHIGTIRVCSNNEDSWMNSHLMKPYRALEAMKIN